MGARMETFIKQYSNRLYKIAFAVLRDEHLAEESVQEILCSSIDTLEKTQQLQDLERILAALVTRRAIEKKGENKKVPVPIESPNEQRNRRLPQAKLFKVVYK